MPETQLDKLAIRMFRQFARFEYSLKTAGFVQNRGHVRADWIRFATSIQAALENPVEPELRAAIDYILQNPPKKQVIKGGMLQWAERPPTGNSTAETILLYVCRVRNNLFHGGKFNAHWFDPNRSAALLKSSLTILDGCLRASANVRDAFHDPQVHH